MTFDQINPFHMHFISLVFDTSRSFLHSVSYCFLSVTMSAVASNLVFIRPCVKIFPNFKSKYFFVNILTPEAGIRFEKDADLSLSSHSVSLAKPSWYASFTHGGILIWKYNLCCQWRIHTSTFCPNVISSNLYLFLFAKNPCFSKLPFSYVCPPNLATTSRSTTHSALKFGNRNLITMASISWHT